jgi:mRNA interferase MazF
VKRGDVVLVALAGDYGKPRPALIIQSDSLTQDRCSSIVVCPMTSDETGIVMFRVPVEPTPANGLRKRCEVVVEKIAGVQRTRLGQVIGRLERKQIRAVEQALTVVLGFAEPGR